MPFMLPFHSFKICHFPRDTPCVGFKELTKYPSMSGSVQRGLFSIEESAYS